jgi:hypothetical protein
MEGTVNAPHGFAVFLDHFSRVKLGVHHNRVHRGMSEERLDYVYGSVVVQMLGGEDSTTVVRDDNKRRTIRSLQAALD